MDKVKVIFRKVKSGDFKGDIIAFFPELPATFRNMVCYQHIGQHGEACIDYYYNDTVKATSKEYKTLFEELKSIYDDCQLVVGKKINQNKLSKMWENVLRGEPDAKI